MSSDSIVILGVPVDNLDKNETLSRLFSMARSYDEDGRPRMAVAVTAETLLRLRASSDKTGDKPEKTAKQDTSPDEETPDTTNSGFLINTLRNADLMIPVGLPVAWAARILGIKLKKRISAAGFFTDFLETALAQKKTTVLLLRQAAALHHHGRAHILYDCFFLTQSDSSGCSDGMNHGQSPADTKYSNLAADCAAPLESIHEKINSTGVDFLIIDIHNPDLAAWFEKSKNRIHVPVILIVSGTGEILRASLKSNNNDKREKTALPSAARKRFSTDFAKRLYHHYFELGLLVLPLVIYQKYNQAMFTLRHQPSTIPSVKNALPKTARGLSVKIISMPDPLDASVTEDIRAKIRTMSQIAPKIVLDFSRVNFMDSSGLGLLMGLCRMSSAENREIFLTGVTPKIDHFFKLTKTIDFFEDKIMQSLPEILERIKNRISTSSFYYLALIRSNAVVLHFYGKLDASELFDINEDTLMDQVADKEVILSLTDLEFIDSAGIRLLVKLHRQVSGGNRILIACGMRGSVRRLFSIMGVDKLFLMENSLASAELTLRRHHIRRFSRTREAVETENVLAQL